MTDIQCMIHALVGYGLTEQQIADEAKTTQSTVSRAKKGSDPRYSAGKGIERVYARRILLVPVEGDGEA